jgi:MoxR-like ATPase
VEGYRPYLHEGTPGFRLLPGPFKRIAAAAAQNPDVDHVLIIDEINRANVAKIFGELYFLLEYRNDEMSLQYSAEPFSLPPNLWIIGTMNTADRSIALIDAALRRRFYFIALFPDEPPIKGLLRRWLEKHKQEMSWVADVVDRANSLLDDRDSAIGPSHFLRKELNDEWVQLIWKHSILPYLAEQFYGEEERLSDFDLDLLRQSAEGTGKAEEVTDESTDAPPHTD